MNYRKRVATSFILLTLFSTLPVTAKAQLPLLPGGAIPGIGNAAIGAIPSVPVSNIKLEAKETGISIFGVSIPISWDGLAIIIAKKFIEGMVDSTILWINSGFDGNPAYITNPEQYFTDLADGIAGDFIAGSDLGFLCSPFQTQVRLALQKAYKQPRLFQCTLTDAVANIEAFYDDFDQGGWDAWFSMTQNNQNNPYGAYLDAKIELDSRIASAAGLKREQLNWGSGFLSFEKCSGNEIADGFGGKICLDQNGNTAPYHIVTPGVAIEGQLQNVLGTGVRQLELADEFDELIGALLGQLLKETVFSVKGLFSAPRVSSGSNPGINPPPGVDIDGDNINDIIFGGDSEPSCVYGGEYPNCQGSKDAEANSGVIWGYVFEDTDRDGAQDAGEPFSSGISVYLQSAEGENLGTNSTFNGIYTFGQLANGQSYKVGVTAPSGYTVTSNNDVSVTARPLTAGPPVQNFGIAPSQ